MTISSLSDSYRKTDTKLGEEMSTVETCSSTFCSSHLNTASSLLSGICESCRELISRKDVLVSVCWECGSITAVTDIRESERPPSYRGLQFPRYLFVKGCRNCLNGNKDLEDSWMTIKSNTKSDKLVDGNGDVWFAAEPDSALKEE